MRSVLLSLILLVCFTRISMAAGFEFEVDSDTASAELIAIMKVVSIDKSDEIIATNSGMKGTSKITLKPMMILKGGIGDKKTITFRHQLKPDTGPQGMGRPQGTQYERKVFSFTKERMYLLFMNPLDDGRYELVAPEGLNIVDIPAEYFSKVKKMVLSGKKKKRPLLEVIVDILFGKTSEVRHHCGASLTLLRGSKAFAKRFTADYYMPELELEDAELKAEEFEASFIKSLQLICMAAIDKGGEDTILPAYEYRGFFEDYSALDEILSAMLNTGSKASKKGANFHWSYGFSFEKQLLLVNDIFERTTDRVVKTAAKRRRGYLLYIKKAQDKKNKKNN